MELTSHPLALWAMVALVCWMALRFVGDVTGTPARAVTTGAVAVIAVYVGLVVWYTVQPTYFDPAEPTITAVAALVGHGHPLYPAIDAPERYVHVYGPLLFIVHAAALAVAGSSIAASKAVGALAVLVALIVAYQVYRRQSTPAAALLATAIAVVIFLMFGNATFWTRAEPLLICSVVIGLASVHVRRPTSAALVLGLATGMAFTLKISGPAYLLPLFAALLMRHGLASAAVAAAIALAFGVAPFLLPDVSITNYVDYLRLSASNGLIGAKLRQNAEWLAFFGAPLVTVCAAGRRRGERPSATDGAIWASATLAAIAIATIGAKPGGGPYHLLPFVPVWLWIALRCSTAAWRHRWVWSGAGALVVVAVILAVPRQRTLYRTIVNRPLAAAVDDVRRFAEAHPSQRIAVGYAGTSRWSDARTEIVFRTRDYLIDAPAVQEHRLSGLEIPAATYQAIAGCRAEYWLIPTGTEPFAVPSAYSPLGPPDVFPEAFRRVFRERYELTSRTAFFDVWRCR